MEVQFYGANCVKLVSKKTAIVIDDLDGKVTKDGDIALFTSARHDKPSKDVRLTIDQPGEYEAANILIDGIAARAHMDEEGAHTATILKITIGDIKIAIVGHIYPELTESQVESIGMIDVLFIPVGGGGYTLDAVGAQEVIKAVEPNIIIPTHYADKDVKYEVPQASLEDVLKNLGIEPASRVQKLKLKDGEIPEVMQLIVLEHA
ncbi:MAG: MBL fold metallo-hydrolase [Candidatus Saccharimonadales bacterium]